MDELCPDTKFAVASFMNQITARNMIKTDKNLDISEITSARNYGKLSVRVCA
mgnify:CR=1 FL=1